MSNQTEWRWADPTGQQRLVREEDLRQALATGVIPSNAPVWTRGWVGWKSAHDVPELTGKIDPTASVPPPPNFIVAAQDAFEGKAPTGPAEPPPPPRYVPAPAASDTKIDPPKAAPVAPKPAAAAPVKPPPPIPAKAKSAPPPLPAAAKKKSIAPPPPAPAKPVVTRVPQNLTRTVPSVYKETQRPPAGVAPPPESLPPVSQNQSRLTLQVGVAPPPMMPKLDPLPHAPASMQMTAPNPVYEPPKEPSSKFPTLVMFGDDTVPNTQTQPVSDEAPPIVVPPPEPSNVTHAVTRPPPWGEGAVGIDIPKSPRMPGTAAREAQESEAPRPMELSSSDLSSEARIEVVKAQPLIAAERPRTMQGLGPELLANNRAVVEKAQAPSPPSPPLSQSDVAATLKRPAQTESVAPEKTDPVIRPQHGPTKVDELRARAERIYDDFRERNKDKPAWFLPAIAGGSALVVIILLGVGLKAAFGTSSSSSAVASSSATSTASSSAGVVDTSFLPTPKAPPKTWVCKTAGAPHNVAPKALIGSGVEVVGLGGQIALGFAVAPKEATLELLDATSLASASALHLRSNDPVRRVVALDTAKAAVDSDHKGDKLQGRRTLRANPAIDLGAMDGGLVWAPHGTDKGTKLWSLADADAPIEALRGEALVSGGFAIAFRQSGAIHFGAFAGNPPAPNGGLGRVQGLGPQIGSPALAVSGDRVMVAWADRASNADPWSVRWVTFHAGDENAKPNAFTLPPGGLGEQAMSPGLASLGEGKFLLVWTEGAVSSHQVRGVVFGETGPIGDAFTASPEGSNAGQAQAAVTSDGHGVVAYLAGSGKSFGVEASPIQCVEK